jgi:hypothetical protein
MDPGMGAKIRLWARTSCKKILLLSSFRLNREGNSGSGKG